MQRSAPKVRLWLRFLIRAVVDTNVLIILQQDNMSQSNVRIVDGKHWDKHRMLLQVGSNVVIVEIAVYRLISLVASVIRSNHVLDH